MKMLASIYDFFFQIGKCSRAFMTFLTTFIEMLASIFWIAFCELSPWLAVFLIIYYTNTEFNTNIINVYTLTDFSLFCLLTVCVRNAYIHSRNAYISFVFWSLFFLIWQVFLLPVLYRVSTIKLHTLNLNKIWWL